MIPASPADNHEAAPYEEWRWVEDAFPEEPARLKKAIRNDNIALGGKIERQRARLRKGPKVIPPRTMPTLAEVTMEPEPDEPTVIDETVRDLHMNAVQDLAQEQDRRMAS